MNLQNKNKIRRIIFIITNSNNILTILILLHIYVPVQSCIFIMKIKV
jgi:hypothetical protein